MAGARQRQARPARRCTRSDFFTIRRNAGVSTVFGCSAWLARPARSRKKPSRLGVHLRNAAWLASGFFGSEKFSSWTAAALRGETAKRRVGETAKRRNGETANTALAL